MSYRELLLFSVLICWITFAFLLFTWRGKKSMSISLHAASARKAYYFFAFMQVLAGSLLAMFTFLWFIPHLQLDTGFKLIFLITMICFYITILIPETKGYKKIHQYFAYTFAFMLFVNVLYVLAACNLSLTTQIIGGFVLAYMVFCMTTYARFYKHKEHFIVNNYLRFQIAYLFCYHLFILSAAYLS